MKESISDIINQLQDIDPTRLSFSPFLDLDTQISLAPVSDSPESSVEELHSSSHSFSGSQHSLEEPPVTSRTRGELLVDSMEKIFKIKGEVQMKSGLQIYCVISSCKTAPGIKPRTIF